MRDNESAFRVRLALPSEAAAIADLQLAQMRSDPRLAAASANLNLEEMQEAWRKAISTPPLATYRVLMALAGEVVAGFAAIGPADDPDSEDSDAVITEFRVIEEDGHADRLLHAVVDTLRIDGFERATWWIPSTDDELRTWLTETGWAPDGAHEEVGDQKGNHLRLIRMHTALD